MPTECSYEFRMIVRRDRNCFSKDLTVWSYERKRFEVGILIFMQNVPGGISVLQENISYVKLNGYNQTYVPKSEFELMGR
jgi:hypothetical protein